MKLPPKPQPWEGPIEWDLWGRACAEATQEACAKEAERFGNVLLANAIRNIKIED